MVEEKRNLLLLYRIIIQELLYKQTTKICFIDTHQSPDSIPPLRPGLAFFTISYFFQSFFTMENFISQPSRKDMQNIILKELQK